MQFDTIALASDHRGYWLKLDIIEYFKLQGYEIEDFGSDNDCVSVDYPDYAKKVANYVLENKNSFGVLVCFSGIGMNIAANRFKGIRAVLCYNEQIARLSREHNDANVICFGSRFTNPEFAIRCVDVFANAKLADERHRIRINKIDEI